MTNDEGAELPEKEIRRSTQLFVILLPSSFVIRHSSFPMTGPCQLCERETALTRHHLVPQCRHHNKWNKKNFDRRVDQDRPPVALSRLPPASARRFHREGTRTPVSRSAQPADPPGGRKIRGVAAHQAAGLQTAVQPRGYDATDAGVAADPDASWRRGSVIEDFGQRRPSRDVHALETVAGRPPRRLPGIWRAAHRRRRAVFRVRGRGGDFRCRPVRRARCRA